MEHSASADSEATTSRRWARSTVARQSASAEWDPLDLAHRRAVARPAGPIPFASHLPPAIPTLGANRRAETHSAGAGQGSSGSREARSIRGLHRWHLRGGQKRGHCVGPTKRGKGTKIMAVADRHGLPIAVDVASASPHEIKLVEPTLKAGFLKESPQRLIGDKAYDSDALRADLAEDGIQLITRQRRNRRVKTQDGRSLRRYRRRWKIERLFAWLQNFRRLITRHEHEVANFLGFVQLGCIVILLRQYL